MIQNLLIVDDNRSMRRLIKSVVGDIAANVHECADGADALDAYRELRPEIVLMDIEMPVTDGLSAAREIRATFPQADIIMLTKHESPRIRREAELAGARAFVCKESLLDIRALIAGR